MKKDLQDKGKEIEYLRLALSLCGFGIDSAGACLINEVFKSLQKLGGKFSVDDAVRIEYDVRQRYSKKEIVAISNDDIKVETVNNPI